MKVLQATWSLSGEFLIWGESAVLDTTHSPNITCELELESKQEELLTHPYTCQSNFLSKCLTEAGYEEEDYNFKTVNLSLPTDSMGPLASPRLITAKDFERSGLVSLQVWTVNAVALDPYMAIGFLSSLPGDLPSNVILDDSVQFWVEATKLILELLTRGRFLPSISSQNGSYNALWQIIPTDDYDIKRLALLADSMPPICRAQISNIGSKYQEPSALLESFVAVTSDFLIRSFLRRYALKPASHNNSPQPQLQTATKWVSALNTPVSEIEAPTQELVKLETRLKRWQRTFSPISPVSIRAGFRLLDPSSNHFDSENTIDENLDWKLEFFIESQNNPDDCLSASEIWDGQLGFLNLSEYTSEDLEDFLLKCLGEASIVFSPLSRALEDTYPKSVTLTTDDAYSFLKDASSALTKSGFTVVFPKWWNQPEVSLGLRLKISSDYDESTTTAQTSSVLGMNQLLNFSWEISVGDKTLSLDEFKRLVEEKSSLVQINGSWVELKSAEVEASLKFLETQKSRDKMRLVEALRFGLGVEPETTGLPITGFETSGWVQKLLDTSKFGRSHTEQPLNFNGILRHYQLQGLSWLTFLSNVGCGACLADDMGLGKTIQLLALLLEERNQETTSEASAERINPTLLVAPMSILDNWEREAAKFAPSLKTYIHHGGNRASGTSFMNIYNSVDIIITTYNLAHRDEELFSSVNWGRIVLDEAQNIKNLATKQTQAIRRLGISQFENTNHTSQPCHRIAMSGTPLENHLEELWSILDFLNPNYLGSLNYFRSRFALPIERYRDTQASTDLSQLVAPFILRRSKTDKSVIDDLPEKIEMDVFTGLTQEQAALYQEVTNQMLSQVSAASGMQRKGLVLATITRLKQICNHPALFLKNNSSLSDRSGKLTRLEELLEVILDEGDRVLIFSQFAQMGHLLKAHLQERFGQEVLFLHGALQKKTRAKLVDDFQRPGGPHIFLLSLKVGGLGLNLTAANQIIHFDQWWNPAVQSQATDRAYRIGQKRNVQVRTFICRGTLEEKISAMAQKKKDLADSIVGTTKSTITQMSLEELRDFLQLTKS